MRRLLAVLAISALAVGGVAPAIADEAASPENVPGFLEPVPWLSDGGIQPVTVSPTAAVLASETIPEVRWVSQFGTWNWDYVRDLLIKPDGNIVSVGRLDRDAAVWEHSPSGNQERSLQFGTSGWTTLAGIADDSDGNLYFVGQTTGAFPGFVNAVPGKPDGFIRKVDSAWNELWTSQKGCSGHDWMTDVAVDSTNSPIVAAQPWCGLPGHTYLGGYDLYLAKSESDGTEIWAHQFGTNQYDYANQIAVDASGFIYLVGQTQGALPGQANSGGSDAFIRKYDPSGTEVWTHQFGTAEGDGLAGVALDGAGAVYVAGWTGGVLNGQASSGGTDAFIRKYDTSGTEVWTHQFGTPYLDGASKISVTATGDIVVLGPTQGSMPSQQNLGGTDFYVAGFNSSAESQWFVQLGTTQTDYVMTLAVDATGEIYVGGYTNGVFAGQSASGDFDAFILKLGVTPPTVQDLIGNIINDVQALNLQNGISNSLDAKLANALKVLDDVNEGNDVAAINKLQAFINEVQAQSGNHIPVADAAALIAIAQQIIDLLTD